MANKRLNYNFITKNTIDNIPSGYIANSKIDGFGLFAKRNIAKEEILCIFDGQIIRWEEYYNIRKNLKPYIKEPYDKFILMEWNALDKENILVRPFRTKYSFINHSSCPNTQIYRHPLRLVAIKDIAKDEEFTLDYHKEPINIDFIEKGYDFL